MDKRIISAKEPLNVDYLVQSNDECFFFNEHFKKGGALFKYAFLLFLRQSFLFVTVLFATFLPSPLNLNC